MDDFTHGRQGALWMISSMDATEEGEQNNLKQNNKTLDMIVGDVLFGHCLVLSDMCVLDLVQLEAAGACNERKSAS